MVPRQASVLSEVFRNAVTVDRSKLEPGAALRAAVGVAIPLVLGEATGHVLVGVTASVGALQAGFASLQGTYRSRAAVVLGAAAAAAVSTFVGATVGHIEGVALVLALVWGLAAGMAILFGNTAMAVALQAVLTLLVFSQFRLTARQAGFDALFVLGGGVVQAALVVAVWPLRRYPAERRGLAVAYRDLAVAAQSIPDQTPGLAGSSIAAVPPTTDASVFDPQPFGRRSNMIAYQALVVLVDRIRLELTALGEHRLRLLRLDDTAAVEQLDGVAHAAAGMLAAVADAIRRGRSPQALGAERHNLRAAIDRLDDVNQISGPDKSWIVASRQAALRTCEALAGQLREMVRLTAIPAGAQGKAPRVDPLPEGWASLPGRPPLFRRQLNAAHEVGGLLRANLTLSSQAARHALRLGVTLAVAVAASRAVPAGHGYWLPLTVVVVLRSDFLATFTRGLARGVGTIAGAALVTLLIASVRPAPGVLIALAVGFCWLALTLLVANYASYSALMAALVVTLLAFGGAPAPTIAADRCLYTALGTVLALVAYALWPTWEGNVVPDRLAALVDAERTYSNSVLASWEGAEKTDPAALNRQRLAARLARSNAEASVERWLSEPAQSHGPSAGEAQSVLAAMRRFVAATLTLHAALPRNGLDTCHPEVGPLAAQIDAQLRTAATAMKHEHSLDRSLAPTSSLRALQIQLARQLQAAAVSPPFDDRAVTLASGTDTMVDAIDGLWRAPALGGAAAR